jgi:UDP-N-acetylglucosamine 4,6-dehydratase
MCPADDSHLTLEFADHFVIRPTITFYDGSTNYASNNLGETSVPVAQGFEYNSGRNERFLSVPEIIEFNHLAEMSEVAAVP